MNSNLIFKQEGTAYTHMFLFNQSLSPEREKKKRNFLIENSGSYYLFFHLKSKEHQSGKLKKVLLKRILAGNDEFCLVLDKLLEKIVILVEERYYTLPTEFSNTMQVFRRTYKNVCRIYSFLQYKLLQTYVICQVQNISFIVLKFCDDRV